GAERAVDTHHGKDARLDIEITLEAPRLYRGITPLPPPGARAGGAARARASAAGASLRRRGTSHIASAAIRADILLAPSVRSRNTIGISTTLNPASNAR